MISLYNHVGDSSDDEDIMISFDEDDGIDDDNEVDDDDDEKKSNIFFKPRIIGLQLFVGHFHIYIVLQSLAVFSSDDRISLHGISYNTTTLNHEPSSYNITGPFCSRTAVV